MKLLRISSLILVALPGCSVLVNPDLQRLRDGGSTRDAQSTPDSASDPDVVVPVEDVVVPDPDVVAMCPNNCNDNIACTIDRCNNGVCVNTPDNTACGADARCDAVVGCVPNMMMGCTGPAECNDSNPCTVDACTARVCTHAPFDRDMDRSPAAMVDGRMCGFPNADCDDNNNAINPTAMEVCDRVDNNCNGMIDELPTCVAAPNTTCGAARRIDLTMATSLEVTGTNAGVASTVQAYCGSRGELGAGGELWYAINAPQNRDLWIEAARTTDGLDPVLWVGDGCGRAPVACNDNISNSNTMSRVILRADGLAGTRTVFVAVDAFSAPGGSFTLRLRTQPPAGRDCNSALTFDGGTIRSPTGVGAFGMLSCSGAGGGIGGLEHYHYRGMPGQVRLFTSSGAIAVRRDCGSTPVCVSSGNTFMSSVGDSIIGLERPSSPYTLTLFGP